MPIPPDHRLASAPAPSPLELLAAAARRLPDGALALAAAAGVLLAAAVLAVRDAWLPLALPAAGAAALAGWAIVERTRAERAGRAGHAGVGGRGDAAFRLLESALAVAGGLAIGAFLLVAFGRLFGGIIS